MVKRLTSKDFSNIFKIKTANLPLRCQKIINESNFKYKILTGKEREAAILSVIKTLDSSLLKPSGPQRKVDWEKGWTENLQSFKKKKFELNELIPKFVRTKWLIRLQGNYLLPKSNSFETDSVRVLRNYLFLKYLNNIDTLYEFGAGTGLNLVEASHIFPNLKLVGLDWAKSSCEIINHLKIKLNINIVANIFDLFVPDNKFKLDKNSAVLTIGTLEQLGHDFKPFINYLFKNKPLVIINIETIYELYDQDKLFDYIAAKYLEKRNYLRGYLPYLKDLEKKGKIKILEIKKTFGSFYHDGYTFIVWKIL